MFESLDQQIQEAEGTPPTITQRILRYLGVFAVTVVVLGALYMGIRLMG